MPKLLKLKNKPFWIAAAIILIIGVAFYKQRRTEGFETTYNVVGFLWYGKLKNIKDDMFSNNRTDIDKVIDASDEKVIWKKGDSRPTSSDEQYYVFLGPAATLNSADLKKREESNAKAESGFVCLVVLKDNKYRDKDDNKIIDAYTRIFGMNLLTTTLYWILGGVGALVFLIIIFMMMRNSGGGGNSLNRNYNS